LGIERLEERDVPSAVSWTGYGDQHSWSDFRNWSSKHVPGPTDDVTIALAGAQVSISTPVTVNSLTLSPSGLYSSLQLPENGQTDLTISGTFTWTDGKLLGGFNNPAHVRANGGITLSGGNVAGYLLGTCVIDNAGTATISGVNVSGYQVNLPWHNLAGSELDLLDNGNFGGTLTNDGAIVKTGVLSTLAGDLTNNGSVAVLSGTLDLTGSLTSTGPLSVAGSGTLDFGSSTDPTSGVNATLGIGATITGAGNVGFISGSSVTLADTYSVTGQTNVEVSAGATGVSVALNGNASMGALNLLGAATNPNSTATLTGSADVTVSGPLVCDVATLSGTGRTLAYGSSTIDELTLDGRTFNNYGTATLTPGTAMAAGSDFLIDGASWNNEAGSTLAIQGGVNVYWGNAGAVPQLNNAGTLSWTNGTSTVDFPITNTGALLLQGQNAAVNLAQDFVNSSTVSIDAGSSLAISGNYQQTSLGALDIGIGGPSGGGNGTLAIQGVATLGGTLNVGEQNGYVPQPNDAFKILTFGSVTGDFATKNGLSLGNSLNFTPIYHAGDLTLQVTPASPATHVRVSAPAGATAGNSFTVTITALDANNQVATGYTGTIHFSSSDPKAVLPANYVFTAADAGLHTFTVTLKTAGAKTVTATDTQTATITGKATVTVQAATATHLKVTAAATATAGKAFSITVTALDAYNNTATGYLGTVHFSTSDAQGVLPANYTFVAADKGKHTFTSGAVLKTAGKQTVKAIDTVTGSIGGAATVTVNPAAASLMLVSGFPTSATHGVAYTFTVTVLDAYGNIATGYRGTVHLGSSDVQAALPADYTFTAADKGKHSFSATLNTLGTQSLTATDTVTATLTGSEGGITVS
jgi:hypothetical protein